MNLPITLRPSETTNLVQMQIGALTVFYSFLEPIAFLQSGKVVARNFKGSNPHSRNHINRIEPDTGLRIDDTSFEAQLTDAMRRACAEVLK